MTNINLKVLLERYRREKRKLYFPQKDGPTRIGYLKEISDTFIILQNDRNPGKEWVIFTDEMPIFTAEGSEKVDDPGETTWLQREEK